ncbi:MAG TPA: amino acid permease [Bryobacteraceae bacterium]|nr:amino acid permease [Bryobacteraceae bacterium]
MQAAASVTRQTDDLSRFGYAQELFRSMGGFSNFAISFSIISILTGAVTLYGYGLEMGGPLEMSFGWPLATVATLAIACSMAELCSAYPTSGAMYHWAADLGGPAWGWFVAWFNIFGLIAAQAGINYSCAQFILPFLGIPATPLNLYLMFAFILLNQALLNQFGVRLVARLNDLSVAIHIAGVLAIVAILFWMAPRQPVSFLTTAINSNGRSPYWWAFLLGLLQAHWTFTGFDASAHMAEETLNARRRAPWGIVLSVAVAGVVGYALLIGMTLSIHDIGAVLAAKDPAGNTVPAAVAVFQQALGARAGNVLSAMAAMAMWFCGLSCIASASRALFSLARDNGTPLHEYLRRIHSKRGTPGPAIWAVVIASAAAMVWSGAIPVVTSLSTVSLYVAYVLPVALALHARRARPGWTDEAVWSLGRCGTPLNWLAVLYTGFLCIVLVMPPNELAGYTFGGLLAVLVVLYASRARYFYKGPEWAITHEHVG